MAGEQVAPMTTPPLTWFGIPLGSPHPYVRPPSRPRPVNFAGARGAAQPPDVIAGLDFDRWALSLKRDGLYAQLTTDARGRIDSVVSQLGREIPGAADLLGIHAAPPYSTLVGECMLQTEAGIAATAALGYVQVHLFDCLRLAGQPLARQPYAERHGSLYRAASWCESEGLARRREWTLDARGDAHALSASGSAIKECRPVGRQASRGAAATRHGGRLPALPGRYVAAIPRDLRRLPIAPLVRGRADALALWSRIERDGLEGAVAVDLRAPVGRGKRKIKVTDTLGCTVIAADASCSEVTTGPLTFTVPGVAEVGSVVEIAHHGYYASGVPRFARIVRARPDKTRGGLIEWAA